MDQHSTAHWNAEDKVLDVRCAPELMKRLVPKLAEEIQLPTEHLGETLPECITISAVRGLPVTPAISRWMQNGITLGCAVMAVAVVAVFGLGLSQVVRWIWP